MQAIDPQLIEKARLDLLSAMASFGKIGDDPFAIARLIVERARAAGFTAVGCERLGHHLRLLLGRLLLERMDPFVEGRPVDDPSTLFDPERLGGLFDPRPVVAPDPQESERDAEARDRALIEQLISATRLYGSSDAVKELLAFVARLRSFAPFNAMLLHIQKPGLTYAATAADWHQRFGRAPKLGARPLLILRTMGPVDFVFDVQDTDGRPLPDTAFSFPTLGDLSEERFAEIKQCVIRSGIDVTELDYGDASAGWIRRLPMPSNSRQRQRYIMAYNCNHAAATRLVTIAHELAHLYLGHLGADSARRIRDRRDRSPAEREVEAEMTAFLVAKRHGLTPRSESYLDRYKGAFSGLDLYVVMRATNEVETAMGISAALLKGQAEKQMNAPPTPDIGRP